MRFLLNAPAMPADPERGVLMPDHNTPENSNYSGISAAYRTIKQEKNRNTRAEARADFFRLSEFLSKPVTDCITANNSWYLPT
jgi:hypothetical protein